LSLIWLNGFLFALWQRPSRLVQLAADILVGCVGPLSAVIADSKSIDESRVRQT
jgi:hypothetical protein